MSDLRRGAPCGRPLRSEPPHTRPTAGTWRRSDRVPPSRSRLPAPGGRPEPPQSLRRRLRPSAEGDSHFLTLLSRLERGFSYPRSGETGTSGPTGRSSAGFSVKRTRAVAREPEGSPAQMARRKCRTCVGAPLVGALFRPNRPTTGPPPGSGVGATGKPPVASGCLHREGDHKGRPYVLRAVTNGKATRTPTLVAPTSSAKCRRGQSLSCAVRTFDQTGTCRGMPPAPLACHPLTAGSRGTRHQATGSACGPRPGFDPV